MRFRVEEIEVREENPFLNDSLNRKPVVELLRDLVCRLDGPFVLAIDSPWGTGKTTVVRMLRSLLKIDGCASVYFNAWKEDYVTDPLVPMVVALDDLSLSEGLAGSGFGDKMAKVKEVATKVAKRGIFAAVKLGTMGVLDLEEVAEDVISTVAVESADDVVSAFRSEKQSLESFRDALATAVSVAGGETDPKPLVFFVDELDRCRPTFAIELLERIKHLFDVKGLIFVLSVDKRQLEAITAAVYGERIDAREYLRRFIDLDLSLPLGSGKVYARSLIERHGLKRIFDERMQHSSSFSYDYSSVVDSFAEFSRALRMSLRQMDRCFTRLALVLMRTPSNYYLDPHPVVFLIIVRSIRPDLYASFAEGDLSPRDLVDEVARISAPRVVETSRRFIVVEAYLIAGDFDSERRKVTIRSMEEVSSDENREGWFRAKEVLSMMRHVRGNGLRDFSSRYLLEKIDLASALADD